jgi:hypothetical protein
MQPETKAKFQGSAEGEHSIVPAFIFGSEAEGLDEEDSDRIGSLIGIMKMPFSGLETPDWM